MHTSPWAVWGRCRGGTKPRMERDLPPPRRPRAGVEEVLGGRGRPKGTTRGKLLEPRPPGWGSGSAQPLPREGGRRTNIAVLTRAPTPILGVPHSFLEGCLFLPYLPQHRKAPSYPSDSVSCARPPSRLAWCAPVSLVTRRRGAASPQPRWCFSQPLPRSFGAALRLGRCRAGVA